MGCCFSRPSGPNSPYPGGAANSSARAINPPPLTLPESASPTNAPQSSRRRRRDQGPLDKHIDKPLRRHSWSTTDRQWTRTQLAKERAEFFDTRVTGRPEVWQTLHAALQQLWEPIPPDATEDEALATAQSIISAAEISLPTGNLANGAYDSLGNYYQLAEHIVSDPSDLLESDGRDAAKGSLEEGEDNTASAEDEDEDDAEAEQRRAEKGKAVADARQEITVRARLSETGRDYQVAVGKSDTVRSIANRLALESNIASTKKIRLAYMGKILKENSPLDAQGWQPGHIVNALVFNKPD